MSGTILRTGVVGLLLFGLCALPMSAAVRIEEGRSTAEATEGSQWSPLSFVYELFQDLLATNAQNSEVVLPGSDGAPALPGGDGDNGTAPPPDTDGPVLYGPGIEPTGGQ